MLLKVIRLRSILISIGLILVVLISASILDPQPKYSETISALMVVYSNEIRAHLNYMAYAQKAISENYPNIAYLFVSFATSESIHASNFKKILIDLGVEWKDIPKPEIKVSATRINLKNALDFEIADIDERYPQALEKIKVENHEAAIRNITYAWESEKQHRDLIKKIQMATGILFGKLASYIEKTPTQYFVCQTCGSTVTELPHRVCPICNSPISQYKEIERIK